METVALLPPAGMTCHVWDEQVRALAGRLRVLTPDLPGYGGVPGPFTFDRAVAEMGRHLGDAGGRVHLCGVSLSATVAVLTCLAHPERVASLVLSGGTAHPPPLLAVQRAVVAAMPEGLIAWLLSRQVSQAMAGTPARERATVIARAADDFRDAGKRTFQDSLGALAHTDLRGALSRIAVPALVLCGERDKANLAGARELAAGIAGAQLRIIPGARHLWNLQYPELFTRTLTDFIGTVTPE